ncbi:MAG: hypothetical protein Ct9H300mP32_3890 [Verrucomicrobiota bacterium]|nr:MAG: hypothetical protein Ct9H300mP32_3890 [Verrucomicrobiota bacterium]
MEGAPIETNNPATIREVARFLRRLHSAPEVPGTFDLPSVIEDYISTARRFNVTLPDPNRRGAGIFGENHQRDWGCPSKRLRATTT